MTDNNSATPAAGWYPDPAGTPRTRWWDGSRWTENYSAPAAPVATTPWSSPAGGATSGGAPAAYPSMQPYGAVPALKAPEGTSPSTPFVWLIALLPVISLALAIAQLVTIDELVATTLDADGTSITPFDLLNYGVSLLLAAATVLFAFFDARTLAARGVPRPFHWAWSFFAFLFYPLYLFGRAIVINRRTGSGLAGIALPIVYLIANIAIFFVAIGIGFQAAFTDTTGF